MASLADIPAAAGALRIFHRRRWCRRILVIGRILQKRANLPVGIPEVVGHYFGVGENRHKVGIAVPAWDDMKMHMISNAGSGNAPLVDTHIEAVRPHGSLQSRQTSLRGSHD